MSIEFLTNNEKLSKILKDDLDKLEYMFYEYIKEEDVKKQAPRLLDNEYEKDDLNDD